MLMSFLQVPAVSILPNMRTSTEVWMPSQWVMAFSPSSPLWARGPAQCRSCCSPFSRTWPVGTWADRYNWPSAAASAAAVRSRNELFENRVRQTLLCLCLFDGRGLSPPASCPSLFCGSSCECWTPVKLSRLSMTWVGVHICSFFFNHQIVAGYCHNNQPQQIISHSGSW